MLFACELPEPERPAEPLLVAVAATLMGICSLLLGVTASKAFHEEVQRLQPHEVDVTAYVVGVRGSELEATRHQARGVVQHVLGPLHPSMVSTAIPRACAACTMCCRFEIEPQCGAT